MPLQPNPPAYSTERPVEGNGSFLVGLRLKNKHVVVVGGGREAAGRVFFALDADALVTVIAPSDRLHPSVASRIGSRQVAYIDRKFIPQDLHRPFLGFGKHEASEVSAGIAKQARRMRIPVNCADIPDLCDFYFMAQYRKGGLQIGVSTNGGGPRLGARLRNMVLNALDDATPAAADGVAIIRSAVRESDESAIPPSIANPMKFRMQWLSRLCDEWSLQDLAKFASNPQLVSDLVRVYARGDSAVPSYTDLLASSKSDTVAQIASQVVRVEQTLARVPLVGSVAVFALV
eukprot:jgi/Hompol1/3092/HPOL_006329-RA